MIFFYIDIINEIKHGNSTQFSAVTDNSCIEYYIIY